MLIALVKFAVGLWALGYILAIAFALLVLLCLAVIIGVLWFNTWRENKKRKARKC
jgi:preprotein translocase subunit YajC